MKTKEELNALKNEVEALNAKLAVLTEEEFEHVFGGYPDVLSKNCDTLQQWLQFKNVMPEELKRAFIENRVGLCSDKNFKVGKPCDNCDFYKTYQALFKR